MLRRVLVDTDIVLDLLLVRQPHFAATARLFTLSQDRQLEGCLASLSFSNLFYILRRAMPAPETVAALRKLRLATRVLPVDERVIDRALASSFADFENAIQHFAALEQGLDAIITRNWRDFAASRLLS